MRKVIALVVAMFGMTLFSGCKKYEEGPLISFRSRTSRVANVWKVQRVFRDGVDVTSSFSNYEETFEKDGSYSYQVGGVFSYSENGNWSFYNKDEEIDIYDLSIRQDRTIYILRLKEDEFWYYYYDNSVKYEVRLKPKS